MRENKVLKIRYIEKYVDENGVNMPVYGLKKITTSHVKRYNNCLYLLAGLKGCSRNLMDFLTDQMDSDNNVVSNAAFIKKFIAVMKEAGIEYGEDIVKKSFKTLREKGFLLDLEGSRGYYKVNPKYFMKNDDSKREELLRLILDFDPKKAFTEIDTL